MRAYGNAGKPPLLFASLLKDVIRILASDDASINGAPGSCGALRSLFWKCHRRPVFKFGLCLAALFATHLYAVGGEPLQAIRDAWLAFRRN